MNGVIPSITTTAPSSDFLAHECAGAATAVVAVSFPLSEGFVFGVAVAFV
jgi:hypothetical protein